MSPRRAMIHRLALGTSGATLILIAAGGIVTSTGAGLAVPDWPTTFGHNMLLFPWSRMVGGVLIEHSHRLDGVALLAAGIAIVLCGQVVLGALTTHAGWLTMHLVGGAVAVTGTGALVAVVLRRARALAAVRWRALAIGGLLVVQVGLGLGAALARFTGVGVPGGELSVVGLPVAHRVVSALLLGLVVTLALHAWRLTAVSFKVEQTSGRHPVISRDSGLGRVTVTP